LCARLLHRAAPRLSLGAALRCSAARLQPEPRPSPPCSPRSTGCPRQSWTRPWPSTTQTTAATSPSKSSGAW
jgi:hypothetical protein